MRILLAIFVLIPGFLAAQEVPIQGPNRDPNSEVTRPNTYQGCVIRSNGTLMLTDASNKDYRLVSKARALESYLGQEVRVTASTINPSDPSADERDVHSQTPQRGPATLDVEDISKIADHCQSPK